MQQFTPNFSSKAMNRDIFKIILMGLMVLDHINYFISPYLADIFHIITRVVAVGFAYLVVEGLYYTHSRKKYLLRLGSWGVFMAGGNWLLNKFVLQAEFSMSILGDNIFLTLFVGAIIVCLWDNSTTNIYLRILSICCLVIFSVIPILEGTFVILPFMFITQITHNNVRKRNISYLALALLFALIEIPMALSIPDNSAIMIFDSIAMNASDVFFILIIPILHFYSGKLGTRDKQLKYIFYVFYPLHLWVIHMIASGVFKL